MKNRLFILIFLTLSSSTSLASGLSITGPEVDGNGNYNLQLGVYCGGGATYYLFENGTLVQAKWCTSDFNDTYSAVNKIVDIYNYRLDVCQNDIVLGYLCASEFGADVFHTVVVDGSEEGGDDDDPPPPPPPGCIYIDGVLFCP